MGTDAGLQKAMKGEGETARIEIVMRGGSDDLKMETGVGDLKMVVVVMKRESEGVQRRGNGGRWKFRLKKRQKGQEGRKRRKKQEGVR